MGVSKSEALAATEFHYGACKRVVGPRGERLYKEVWRRSGATKTWKTRPDKFRVPIKHGLRDNYYLDDDNAHQFHTSANCPLLKEPLDP